MIKNTKEKEEKKKEKSNDKTKEKKEEKKNSSSGKNEKSQNKSTTKKKESSSTSPPIHDSSSTDTAGTVATEKPKKSSTTSTKKNTKKTSTTSTTKHKKEKKTESTPKTTEQILKSEYRKWKKSGVENAGIRWLAIDSGDSRISLRFGDGDSFSVTYPAKYPDCKDELFFVYGEGDGLDAWSDAMMEHTDKSLTLPKLLTVCAKVYLANGGTTGGGEYDFGEYEDGDFPDEDGFAFKEEKVEKGKYDKVDLEFSDKKFLDIGSPAASLRLIKDLKNIKLGDPKVLGFTAEPRVEPGKNLENLYHWIVKLHFDGDLGRDLVESKKKFGIDHVELEMRFSKDYPFQPPFVRVVRPRFKFHTGHVTVGGSICMELLTNSGWRSTNDIESILIQIRAEMQGGNARLDLGSSSQYSESEAWDAFNRAAKTHGWDIKNIGPTMFPSVK